MRCLRALLSAGRLARGAGATTPAGVPRHSGGVDRRKLLGFAVAAPVLAPAVAQALAEEPFSARLVGMEFIGGDVQRAGLVLGELSSMTYAEAAKSLAAARRSASLTTLASAACPEAFARAVEQERAALIARGLWAPGFIDDVGSGP